MPATTAVPKRLFGVVQRIRDFPMLVKSYLTVNKMPWQLFDLSHYLIFHSCVTMVF